MHRPHSVGEPQGYTVLPLSEGIWGVCSSSGFKHSMAFCIFALCLMLFLEKSSSFSHIRSATCYSCAVTARRCAWQVLWQNLRVLQHPAASFSMGQTPTTGLGPPVLGHASTVGDCTRPCPHWRCGHEIRSNAVQAAACKPPLVYTGPFGITFAMVFFVVWFVLIGGFVIFGSYSELQ